MNGHISQMELSKHFEQTSPDLISAIVRPVAPSSASKVFDMGFPRNHANRRRVALPL